MAKFRWSYSSMLYFPSVEGYSRAELAASVSCGAREAFGVLFRVKEYQFPYRAPVALMGLLRPIM